MFHNCKLHQDTSFDKAIFPEPSGSNEAARAYRTLKLAFSQQQATREEQRFFRLEMAEEAASTSLSNRCMFLIYQWISDFGFSLWRPTLLLVGTLLIFLLFYNGLAGYTLCLPWHASCEIKYDLIEFGILQTLPLPGLDKWGDDLRLLSLFPKEGLVAVMVAVSIILHKAISLLALFLIGLALRNLFKMK